MTTICTMPSDSAVVSLTMGSATRNASRRSTTTNESCSRGTGSRSPSPDHHRQDLRCRQQLQSRVVRGWLWTWPRKHWTIAGSEALMPDLSFIPKFKNKLSLTIINHSLQAAMHLPTLPHAVPKEHSLPVLLEAVDPWINNLCEQTYNATRISLIRYKCNTWAAPTAVLDNFNVCHCKHLHTIVVRWSDTFQLQFHCLWKWNNKHVRSMFGHVLQNPKDTLAHSPEFHCTRQYRARNGSHCTNLLSVMRNYVKEVGLSTLRSRKQAPT